MAWKHNYRFRVWTPRTPTRLRQPRKDADAERLGRYADRLVSEAQSQITSSSRLGWVAITVLVFWWWSNITTLDVSAGQPGAPAERLAELSAAQASIAASCGPIQAAYTNEEEKRTGVKADADEFWPAAGFSDTRLS